MFYLTVLSIFDSLRDDRSALRHYEKKLHEYQEHEAEVLIDIGVIYLDRGETERAVGSFEEALETYRKLKFHEGVAYASELLGDSLMSQREFDRAMKCYSEALSIYSDINSRVADELRDKIYEAGKIREAVGVDDTEPEPFQQNSQSTDIQSETQKIFRLADDLMGIIDSFESYGKYWEDRDMDAINSNLESATIIRDLPTEALLNLLIGRYRMEEGELYDALKFIKRSNRIFRESGDSKGVAVSLVILGVLLFLIDERENLYNVFKEAIEIFRSLGLEGAERVTIKIIDTLTRS